MGSTKWKNNNGIDRLTIKIKQRRDDLKKDALVALELSVIDGAIALQDLLEAATTPTGERRAAKGGFPGRHRSGNMVASVSHNGDKPRRRGNILSASWGWFAGEFEQYMKDQDLGEGNIPAAHALADSFNRAKIAFQIRMKDVVRGRGR